MVGKLRPDPPRMFAPRKYGQVYIDHRMDADVKRGRKAVLQLPDSVLANKDPDQAEGLVQGFKILQKLLSARNIVPFLEEPNENECDIMASYYDVIDDPMWFKKVKEKYINGEYSTLPEFVLDVRKVFANCFRFWGPKGHLTKLALKLETLLEQELALLPADTQAVCSMESTHGFNPEDLVYKKEGVTSLLLQWVINEQSEKEMAETEELPLIERKEQQDTLEKEILSWENGILYSEESVQDYINSMYELPQIGLFLSTTASTLNLEKLSQYEVERMLLVPQFSRSLAVLMTSLLSTRKDRTKVLYGPPMPYEVWSARLSNKVFSWYKAYHSKKNKFVEVLASTGIEHMFWLVMGEPNPLEKFQFHELHFQKRVWILKTLCDTIMHSHKTMYDLLSYKTTSGNPQVLGEDRKGNSFYYFPAFSDLRVYKQAKSSYSKFNINRWEKLVRVPMAKGDEDCPPSKCVLPSKNDFELVATTTSELRIVYTKLIETEFPSKGSCDTRDSSLLQNIDKLLRTKLENESKYSVDLNNVRLKMYSEWKTIYDRPESVSSDILYWEKPQDHEEVDDKKPIEGDNKDHIDKTDFQDKEPHQDEAQETSTILRERKSKTESHFNMKMLALNEARGESDTSDESDDLYEDSEEEWVASKSKRKSKQPGRKRRRGGSKSLQNSDSAQEAVEMNIKKNEELEKKKKDEKQQRLNNTNLNVIKRDDDALISTDPKRNQIKCIASHKLLKNLSGISVKNEPVKVIENLVATEIKAEKTKPESPETIDIDDDDEEDGNTNDVSKKISNGENIKMIHLNLRVDQPPSTPVRAPSPIDDDIQVLQASKSPMMQMPIVNSTLPGAPLSFVQNSLLSPASQPQRMTRLQSPSNLNVQRGLFYPNSSPLQKNPQLMKGPAFSNIPPYRNLTPIKQTFPVVKNSPTMKNVRPTPRLSSPRIRNPRMAQPSFRGMAPQNISPRVPNQVSYPRQRFRLGSPAPIRNSMQNYSLPRTPVQQRYVSSSVSTPRRQSNSYNTPSPSDSFNSRFNNHARSAPSKAVSNILNSVAIANSLSSGKRKSSVNLNSITITPVNNSAVTITPVLSSAKKVARNLSFSSPNKSKHLVYIKGTIVLDSNDFCYSVQIADGRKFKLTPEQLEECRGGNNGVMPTTISIPVPEDVANLLEPEVVEID